METKYERKDATITNLEDGTSKTYKSKSLARKASHKLQTEKGKLGNGFLRLSK